MASAGGFLLSAVLVTPALALARDAPFKAVGLSPPPPPPSGPNSSPGPPHGVPAFNALELTLWFTIGGEAGAEVDKWDPSMASGSALRAQVLSIVLGTLSLAHGAISSVTKHGPAVAVTVEARQILRAEGNDRTTEEEVSDAMVLTLLAQREQLAIELAMQAFLTVDEGLEVLSIQLIPGMPLPPPPPPEPPASRAPLASTPRLQLGGDGRGSAKSVADGSTGDDGTALPPAATRVRPRMVALIVVPALVMCILVTMCIAVLRATMADEPSATERQQRRRGSRPKMQNTLEHWSKDVESTGGGLHHHRPSTTKKATGMYMYTLPSAPLPAKLDADDAKNEQNVLHTPRSPDSPLPSVASAAPQRFHAKTRTPKALTRDGALPEPPEEESGGVFAFVGKLLTPMVILSSLVAAQIHSQSAHGLPAAQHATVAATQLEHQSGALQGDVLRYSEARRTVQLPADGLTLPAPSQHVSSWREVAQL